MAVVLIAFERESEQSAVEQLLSGRGHQVQRSANGLAALDAARRDPPDVIVSDIVLPRMDGFALCRKWKQDERLQSIPFIFYTRRHDDPKYERFALELGAERFLARAVAPDALLAAVDELSARAPARAAAPPASAPAMMATGTHAARAPSDASLKQLEQKHLEAIGRATQTHERLKTQVSELETMNERLSASETRFRRIFEANPLPMWIADHETGGFIAVNEAAIAFYGYPRPEFLSMKASALAPNSKAQDVAAPLQHKRKDGSTVTVALSVQEIDFDGRRADLVSAFDLSEHFAREQQLREEAHASRAVLESMPDGVLILDGANRVIEANPAYCRMSGYSRDELIKMKLADIEDQSSGEETLKLHMGRTSGSGRYEVKHRRRDGTFIEVEAVLAPSMLADGDSMLMIRDVSQRRRELLANKAQQRQLQFLVDLFKQSESFDESAIVRRLIDQANDVTNSPLAFLYFVGAEHDTVQLAAWKDRDQSHATMASGEPLPIAKASALIDCVRAKRASSSNDLTVKPQTDGLPSLQRYLAVPIVSEDHAVAILGVANREAGYTETDQRNLTSLADGAWRVLHSKRAHAQTLGSLQRTDVALQAMIDAFVRVGERHDPFTAGSARRLAALAVALAREAGLDGERQHGLRIAALLHDVGNIAVPATILAKPGPLTETELALMRTHVEEGCRLLAEIDFSAPVADIVYQSHERYDGSGYPRGLKGEEILLEARILNIADTVEAMCSPRPYRPAAGMDAAIEEINRGAGRLYDLKLVAACTRLVRQHGFVLPE
jgi:PAS domain S-box-containing protein